MRQLTPIFAMLAALSMPMTAEAQLYKCRDADGRTAYSDRPCPGNMKSQALNADSPTTGPKNNANNASNGADGQEPAIGGKHADRIRQIDKTIAEQEAMRDKLYERLRFEQSIVRGGKPPDLLGPEGSGWEQSTSEELHLVSNRYRMDIDSIDDKIRTLRSERRRLLKAQ